MISDSKRRISCSLLQRGLYLILTEPRDGYERLCQWAVEAKLPAVQLRYKGNNEWEHLALARKLRQIINGSSTLFIVNDRPDIAIMADADGLHLGQDDLPATEVRHLIGPNMLFGLSTHNLNQVADANDKPVDYIGFGPLFATNSKAKPDPIVGPEMLPAACNISRHPIVAIGGLNLERIKGIAPYAQNAAVISAVCDSSDPLSVMRKMQSAILGISLASRAGIVDGRILRNSSHHS
jgi:thiamine-phosphate pyrophosphorylase